ncbi:Alpha-tubulin N-acetyltransferase [Aphelenchoides fujianensis]|nr:Alpha-tubulin N-acetyltransferase [Aphelenchoides fujianensis]
MNGRQLLWPLAARLHSKLVAQWRCRSTCGRSFGSPLVQLDGQRLEQLRNAELTRGLEALFRLSAESAGAKQPRTSCAKLAAQSDQRLYVLWEADEAKGTSVLLGFVRVGRRSLFLLDRAHQPHEGELLCVFDAYVHRGRQREGAGRRLFDFVLRAENTRPHSLALDCPTAALLGFLARAYGLERPVWQNTNFVVFQRLFDSLQPPERKTPEGWRREAPRPIVPDGPADARLLKDSPPGQPAEETLSQRAAQTRQRKRELLSNNPLW